MIPNCQHCHNPFQAKRPWQKFCSPECRHAENNGKRGAAPNFAAGITTLQEFVWQYNAYVSDGDALRLLKDLLRAVGVPTKTPSQ